MAGLRHTLLKKTQNFSIEFWVKCSNKGSCVNGCQVQHVTESDY